MPRKANLDAPTRLEISIPTSERARLDLLLFSAVDGRVPQGKYQEFFRARMKEFFERDSYEISPGLFLYGTKPAIEELKKRLNFSVTEKE